MPENDVSEQFSRLVRRYIPSVEHLEVLLLVSAAPERVWSPEAAYQEIKSSLSSVRERLVELCSQGFLVEQVDPTGYKGYQFRPASDELSKFVSDLAVAYSERRVRMIEMIYSPPPSAIDEFSEAFRFKRNQ